MLLVLAGDDDTDLVKAGDDDRALVKVVLLLNLVKMSTFMT